MLTSGLLQIIAMVAMTIDHIGYFFPGAPIVLRYIGRIAFALYAFMLAEGFIHSKSRGAYFVRILIFAIITQFVMYVLGLFGAQYHMLNVLFELALGFIALICLESGAIFYPVILLVLVVSLVFEIEYGAAGIITICIFYLTQKHLKRAPALRIVCNAAALLFLSLATYLATDAAFHFGYILAIIPIALYGGKKGRRMPRYLPYIYYPAHYAVLCAVRLICF